MTRAPKIGTHNAARIVGVVGASGMGKGATIKSELLPTHRGPVVVWSPLEETDRYAHVLDVKASTSLPDLIDAWKAGRSAVYVPPMNPKLIADRFDIFCRAVWHMTGAAVIVEEIARVTTPSWAPGSWRNLSTAGRHRGLMLIATMQRPAQCDKDFLGNCTEIRCFRVNYENDARVMSNVLRVPPAAVLELEKLTYIRRDLDARRNDLHRVGEGVIEQAPVAGRVDITAGNAPAQKKTPPAARRKSAKSR